MTTHNTGNPVGPDGSSDPRDLGDNAQVLDMLINSTDETTTSRLGVQLYTWDGIRKNIIPLGISYGDLSEANSAITSGEIPSGSFFFIRSVSNNSIADEYQNIAGVATATGKSYPSTAFVTETADLAESIDNRTEGLKTQGGSTYPFEVIDAGGKGVIYVDDKAVVTTPGGIAGNPTTGLLNIYSDAVASVIKANASLSVGDNEMTFDSTFPYEIVDKSGRGLMYFTAEGKAIFPGGISGQLSILSTQINGDIFAIGDSITANGVAHSGGGASGTSYAPTVRASLAHAWASLKSKGRLMIAGISATPGYTVSQIASIHLPNAIAAKNTFCIVLGGRNDIIQGVSIDNTTIPTFASIFSALMNAGIIPIVCTSPAQNNSGNDTWRAAEHKLNNWLRAYARKNKLPLVDFHKYTVDPLTGNWLAGMSPDGVHPDPPGAKVMGNAMYDGLIDWIIPTFPQQADEQLAVEGLTNNKMPNPLFLTNTVSGTPDGWTLTSGATSSLTTDSAVRGNAWTLAGTASITVTVNPGKKMALGYFVKSDSGRFECYALAGDSTSTTNLAGIRDWLQAMDEWGYFYYEFTVPSDVTQVTVVYRAGTPSPKLAQLGLFELTEI
ncbi:hypothetical protein BFS14_01700 [Serratia fonticola]|uniref:SGNH/GDSL hydrolase family protein n=1 Tax=Serratia fonticola TaxID=47917 RepID=UPI0008FD4D32|nr:SGNH/GDSL hydrolase family protein [Serratia fonticola]OIX96203.1 hypothetical protein BFS14_01700 [Serratia fonticola]QCR60874.1 SGNH/GDSL hydrolase family protein [Serratia fonticola]